MSVDPLSDPDNCGETPYRWPHKIPDGRLNEVPEELRFLYDLDEGGGYTLNHMKAHYMGRKPGIDNRLEEPLHEVALEWRRQRGLPRSP